MSSRKAGCCVLCDASVFQAFAGFVVGARRYEVVLMSGSTASLSTCSECKLTPETLPVVWRRCAALTADNHPDPDEHMLNSCMLFLYDVPMGVIYDRPWEEVLRG